MLYDNPTFLPVTQLPETGYEGQLCVLANVGLHLFLQGVWIPIIPGTPVATEPSRLTNVLTKNLFGRWKTYTPADQTKAFTTNFSTELESGFEAIRFGYLNAHTEAITGLRFSVAVTNKFHSAQYIQDSSPTGTWIDGDFPVCPPRISVEQPSLTWAPWISLTDVPQVLTDRKRPLIQGRLEMPAGKVCTIPHSGLYGWNDTTMTPRLFRAVSQPVAGVSAKETWVGGTVANSAAQSPTLYQNALVPVIQYVSRASGKQILMVGDSTVQGLGSSVKDMGAIPRACLSKSTPEQPIEYFNGGIHAQGYSIYSQVVNNYADAVRPTHVFYQPWSVNDSAVGGHTDAMIEGLKGANALVINKLQSMVHTPKLFFLEPLPCSSTFKNLGAGDAKRRSYITDYMPKLKAGTQVTGYADSISGDIVNGQTIPVEALMFDGAHPNDAGHNILSNPVKSLL